VQDLEKALAKVEAPTSTSTAPALGTTDKRTLILTVDGISVAKTAQLPAARSAYLQPIFQKITADSGAIVTWREWSGDALKDTSGTVTALRAQILQLVQDKQGRPLVIVTHSWGGVLAYLALKDLTIDKSDPLPAGAVDLFTTIHTPLGMPAPNAMLAGTYFAALRDLRTYVESLMSSSEPVSLPSVRTWENYYSKEDELSGPISAADVNVNTRRDHSGSYTDPAMQAIYARAISKAAAP
jgi:hypothetical protein